MSECVIEKVGSALSVIGNLATQFCGATLSSTLREELIWEEGYWLATPFTLPSKIIVCLCCAMTMLISCHYFIKPSPKSL